MPRILNRPLALHKKKPPLFPKRSTATTTTTTSSTTSSNMSRSLRSGVIMMQVAQDTTSMLSAQSASSQMTYETTSCPITVMVEDNHPDGLPTSDSDWGHFIDIIGSEEHQNDAVSSVQWFQKEDNRSPTFFSRSKTSDIYSSFVRTGSPLARNDPIIAAANEDFPSQIRANFLLHHHNIILRQINTTQRNISKESLVHASRSRRLDLHLRYRQAKSFPYLLPTQTVLV